MKMFLSVLFAVFRVITFTFACSCPILVFKSGGRNRRDKVLGAIRQNVATKGRFGAWRQRSSTPPVGRQAVTPALAIAPYFAIVCLINSACTPRNETDLEPKQQSLGGPIGFLDHVSQRWIEGWSCDTADFTLNVNIAIFATQTQGDGTCLIIGSDRVCRVGQGIANARRSSAEAIGALCGGNRYRGFRIPTSLPYLVDREVHLVYALATDAGGSQVQLGNPYNFDSNTLYSEEPIPNIDDHILIDHGFTLSETQADYDFSFFNHTLFTLFGHPLTFVPSSDDIGAATGFSAPEPRQTYQRSDAPCSNPLVQHCDAMQALYNIGVLIDTTAYGSAVAGIHVYHGWQSSPRPWRSIAPQDKLRVSGYFKQPIVFPDGPGIDTISVWYYVLYLTDRTTRKSLWWGGGVFQSRDLPDPAQRTLAYPWVSITWVDYGPTVPDGYSYTPLAPISPWLSPCSGSATFGYQAHATEYLYCLEISGSQFQSMLQNLNQTAAISDAQRPAGAPRFGTISEDPGNFDLGFFLVDIEAWGPGTVSKIALSMRELNVYSDKFNFNPVGYLETDAPGRVFSGWVCDADDYARPLDVHFYATNIPGSGCPIIDGEVACFLAGTTANLPREQAVADNCGGYANHGFYLPFPSVLIDGRTHRVTAKPLNYPTGPNFDLNGSPVTVGPY